MRTWFDRTIEAIFIIIAIYSVITAGQIMVEISNLPLLQ